MLLSGAAIAAEPAQNLASWGAGALLVEVPAHYRDDWSADYLLDDNPATGWAAPEGDTGSHTLVIELAAPADIVALRFDAAQVALSKARDSYPGKHAGDRAVGHFHQSAVDATGRARQQRTTRPAQPSRRCSPHTLLGMPCSVGRFFRCCANCTGPQMPCHLRLSPTNTTEPTATPAQRSLAP